MGILTIPFTIIIIYKITSEILDFLINKKDVGQLNFQANILLHKHLESLKYFDDRLDYIKNQNEQILQKLKQYKKKSSSEPPTCFFFIAPVTTALLLCSSYEKVR